jgi:hypothetical protein
VERPSDQARSGFSVPLERAQVVSETTDLFIKGVEFQAGFGDEESVIRAVGLEKQVGVVEDGFGTPGAEGEGLETGKVGLFEKALEFFVGFGTVFGRALRTEAP